MSKTALQKDNERRVKKVRAQTRAEANAAGRKENDGAFAKREQAYLKANPHLALQTHCGLCEDSARPTKLVIMPNGVKLYSAWYEVPTWANQPKAFKEQMYLHQLNGF